VDTLDLYYVLGKGSFGLAIVSWSFAVLFGFAGITAVTSRDYLIGFIFSAVAAGLLLVGIYYVRKKM
jgi:hypothetical protein